MELLSSLNNNLLWFGAILKEVRRGGDYLKEKEINKHLKLLHNIHGI